MEGNLLREWPAMYGHVRRVEIEETPYIHFRFLYEHIARRIRSVRRSKPPHSKASARRNREGAKLLNLPCVSGRPWVGGRESALYILLAVNVRREAAGVLE